MSTLKVNKLRDTAGSADAITLDPNGGAVLAGVTTVTSVKVGAAVTISESGIEATGVGITVANINGGQIGGRRNLIINGAMQVAQRGTSSTVDGYGTVDRFLVGRGGTDEAPTQSQVDVASGTTPYTLGFRKALKITNGDQTGGAGSGDYMYVKYAFEAQDIANSGWDYTSASSFITLSFWVKSSVAQSFKGYLITQDGTAYLYPFETGSLSADTWTKVTKTISGNSNLTFNNDNGSGLELYIWTFIGTDYTASSVTEDAWSTYASATRTKDATSTWYTTNDATFEVTGMQLEVGAQATAFEHRSFGEELALCQRYYFKFLEGNNKEIAPGWYYNGSHVSFILRYPTTMRTAPTGSVTNVTNSITIYRDGAADQFDTFSFEYGSTEQYSAYNSSQVSGTAGQCGIVRSTSSAAKIEFSAEL